ncbi:MAG: type II toxin-antitoxin system RelE/ParE family toxin [Deltaproteobacteria bacterium]|nr:type II toxin-antitoxin system RelE/ParE family toxin [Deltaproteobacteria bacterium]
MSNLYSVKIQKEAINELDQIFRFIFQGAPTQAKKFVKELEKKALSLAQFPNRGSRIKILEEEDEEIEEIRFIEHKRYLIFYTLEEVRQTVTILHFSSPGRNWIELFLN